MAAPLSQWPDIPIDLIHAVLSKLPLLSDHIRFRAVCKRWRSAAPPNPHSPPRQLPWLMLPNSSVDHAALFFSLTENKIYQLDLPEIRGKHCCGSSIGWLLMVEKTTPGISLVNPLTREVVHLPPMTTFPDVVDFSSSDEGMEYSIRGRFGELVRMSMDIMHSASISKAVLSSNPSTSAADSGNVGGAVVMISIFYTWKMAFCRVGDTSWTALGNSGLLGSIWDITHHKGKFYVVGTTGTIAVCDIGGASPSLTFVSTAPQNNLLHNYLVESPSGEDLLLVSQYWSHRFKVEKELSISCKTERFEVVNLDLDNRWPGHGAGRDSLLFLGKSHSLALPFGGILVGCKEKISYLCDSKPVRLIYDVDCDEYVNYGNGNGGGKGNPDEDLFYLVIGNLGSISHDLGEVWLDWPQSIWFTPSLC